MSTILSSKKVSKQVSYSISLTNGERKAVKGHTLGNGLACHREEDGLYYIDHLLTGKLVGGTYPFTFKRLEAALNWIEEANEYADFSKTLDEILASLTQPAWDYLCNLHFYTCLSLEGKSNNPVPKPAPTRLITTVVQGSLF